MATRRLLLGDWNRYVRDPIDVLRIAFIAGTVVYWALGRSTAIGLTAASIVLVIARLIDLPRPYDLMLLGAMVLIAGGTALDLYGRIAWYDKLVHGLSPFMWAPVRDLRMGARRPLPTLAPREGRARHGDRPDRRLHRRRARRSVARRLEPLGLGDRAPPPRSSSRLARSARRSGKRSGIAARIGTASTGHIAA
jgi:hypothetical protein